VESGKVKVAIISGRTLKVSGQKVGITLDESSQASSTWCCRAGRSATARLRRRRGETDSPGVSARRRTTAVRVPVATRHDDDEHHHDHPASDHDTRRDDHDRHHPLPPPRNHPAAAIGDGRVHDYARLEHLWRTLRPASGGASLGEVYNKSGQKIADLGVDCLYAGPVPAASLRR